MKLILHPETDTNTNFSNCYMVTSDDYKGSVLKISDINLSETTDDLEFNVELKFLLLNGELVTDPFITAEKFEDIKPKVGQILLDAIRNMVIHHAAEKMAENISYKN